MKMPKVKICGLKRMDEIEAVNAFDVTYAGFIFAPSKRQVTIDMCQELSSYLRPDIMKVGVFVDLPMEEVEATMKACQLDIAQLHGKETVDMIKQLNYPVFKSIPMKDKKSLAKMEIYQPVVDGILFETAHQYMAGGTGQSFDWHLLEGRDSKDCRKEEMIHPKWILAGGLKPENIRQAIEIVKPDIVDVNSGVEEDGYKTYEKLDQLFKELKI